MALPTRATIDDLDVVCGYLATKPTGATLAEARAVVDRKHLDYRKLNALKFWGLVEEVENKLKITELGRQSVKDQGAHRSQALQEVIRHVRPYQALVERAVYRHEKAITSTDAAAHWHQHFKSEVSDSEKILNDQAVCFFQVAQGADLGILTVGRKGSSTRFEFDSGCMHEFVDRMNEDTSQGLPASTAVEETVEEIESENTDADDPKSGHTDEVRASVRSNRVFITHGKNLKILDQVKQIVTFGKFEPVIAMEHETAAKPVPQKVMDDMKTCGAAVIHVSTERVLLDQEGNEVHLVNENVLIEIGAAMALYDGRFVLLVEEGVKLPSNLQGLYECRYHGSELNMEATMKLLEAFNEFGQQ